MRPPIYGLVPPGNTITVALSPPFDVSRERLVIAKTDPQALAIELRPDAIVAHNNHPKYPVGFVLTFVPLQVAGSPFPNSLGDLWILIKAKAREFIGR